MMDDDVGLRPARNATLARTSGHSVAGGLGYFNRPPHRRPPSLTENTGRISPKMGGNDIFVVTP